MAQFPLYYKNSKPVGPSTPTGKRWKENYLFLLILVAFVILIVGNLWFVPPIEEGDGYERVYNEFNPTVITDSYLVPTEPTLLPSREVNEEMQDSLERQRVVEQLANQLNKNKETPKPGGVDEKYGQETNKEDESEDLEQRVKELKEQNPKLGIPGEVDGNRKEIAVENAPSSREEGEKEGEGKEEGEPGADVKSPPVAVATPVVDEANEQRRLKVIEMVKEAWHAYTQYAMGQNELKPMSKRGHSAVIFGRNPMGATIVDSLDTLYLMGLMEEFELGKHWVEMSLNFDQISGDVSVFEMNIRYIGGLLSAYTLSGDEVFKEKAVEIANMLMPAFNTPSGIPKSLINLKTGAIKNWGWASGGCSVLAEFGSLHLEFQYLTHLTGNQVYFDKVKAVRQKLKSMSKPDGLYPNFLNPNNGNWGTKHVSVGALGDSFYEYLLKSWLMTSKKDEEARDMYYEAVDALDKHIVRETAGLVYVSDLRNGRSDGKMQHLACFSGGMFALGAAHATERADHFMEIGKGITNTCHETYIRTATKLGAEAIRIDAAGKMSSRSNEKMYLLRPETVESYFILWRLTHDQKYRDWGWEVVEALLANCRIPETGGYSGIKDVYNPSAPKDDVMQSFFLAETMKYLFLLFSDDSVVPLDQWVFNTEAHPFPNIPDIPTPSISP